MHGIARLLVRGSLAAVGSLGMGVAGVGLAGAQDANGITLRSYPVAIHQGTCETLIAEPAYDLGLLSPRPLVTGADDDGVFDGPYAADDFYADGDAAELSEDTLFLSEDVDDDGVFDFGLDRDADGVLTEAEVLERPILWVAEADFEDLAGDLVDSDDPELADLRDAPHAIVIHRAAATDTDYLGCAEIAGAVDEEGELLAAVKPMGSNGLVGIAWFEEGEDGFLGIGGEGGEAEISVFPAMTAQAQGGVQTTPATS